MVPELPMRIGPSKVLANPVKIAWVPKPLFMAKPPVPVTLPAIVVLPLKVAMAPLLMMRLRA